MRACTTSRVFKKIRSRINRKDQKNEESKSTIDYSGPFSKEDLWSAQPRFREVSAENRPALFIKHLRMCSIIFDFNTENSKENLGKEMKRQLLLAIVDHITTSKQWFSENVCKEIVDMVSANLFRDLPPAPEDFDPEEDDPVLDAQWPHLQIIYEFLLRFMVSTYTDAKILKKFIDKNFLTNLIGLFRSEDPRERDYLKTILHRVYGKFMSFRSFIRESVNNVFYDVVYENDGHGGVSELLEILGSIVNGFAVPLKAEHTVFLQRVLMPLHKVKNLCQFHQQLAYCTIQFIEKDGSLATLIVQGLLNFWPVQSSTKELLFLNELDEVLDLTSPEDLNGIDEQLFGQIAKSIGSPHFQVAERALFLWNNDTVAQHTNKHRVRILPLLYPALSNNSMRHWNQPVHTLTNNVMRMFEELDKTLYIKVSKTYEINTLEESNKALEDSENFWANFSVQHKEKLNETHTKP